MKNLIRVLIAISALGFVLAVVSTLLDGSFLGFYAQAYSRVCSNLAFISIALSLSFSGKNQ